MANKSALWIVVLAIGSAQPVLAQQDLAPAAPSAASGDLSTEQFRQWLQGGEPVQSSTAPAPAAVPSSSTESAPAPQASSMMPVAAHPKGVLSYESGQTSMVGTLPTSVRQPTADEEAAFNAMIKQNIPLAPSQIVRLRQQIDDSQRAAAIPPNIPPKPVSSTIMVNLAPGTTPPAVRLAQGYVSALVFVDSTGEPWPIASFDIGNPKAVNIQWDGKSNIILIQANSPYTNGDIVVRLAGLPTPITLMLVTGQRVVDYRADIHVSGIGPNTKDVPIGTTLPNSADTLLLGVLDGVAPSGSRQLTVRGADAQAWLLGQKLYLRTRLTVLSPGWIGKMTSPDGMQAYELPKTSSVLISKYGEPAELKIEGF